MNLKQLQESKTAENNIMIGELVHAWISEEDLINVRSVEDLRESVEHGGIGHTMAVLMIDSYNHSLREWLVDNYEYVEKGISEGLVSTSNFDLHDAIKAGQYLKFRRILAQGWRELAEELEK